MEKIKVSDGTLYNFKITDYGGEKKITFYSKKIERGAKYEVTKSSTVDWLQFDNDLKSIGWLAPEGHTVPFPITRYWDLDNPEENNMLKKSLNRTKNKVYDIARANDWEWFVTFTFDKNKVKSRYDIEGLKKQFLKFINHYKERSAPDLKYLFIPELHEDGALHFHGLMSNLRTDDLVLIKTKRHKYLNLYPFYEKFGFSDFSAVKDSKAVSNYITKYITKELIIDAKCKKRYYASNNLDKPTVEYIEEDDVIQFLQDQTKSNDITHITTKKWGELDINWIELKDRKKNPNPSLSILSSDEKSVTEQ